MNVKARIYIIRHGETDENKNHIIQGQLDTALNDSGGKQARLVAKALESIPFDIAFSSDLGRATATAEAILVHHPKVRLHKQEVLRERYMGTLQGKVMTPEARIAATDDSCVESVADFSGRAVSWWKRTIFGRIASMAPSEEPYHILVTTHGGFIGTLVRTLIQSRKAQCAEGVVIGKCFNCSVTIIEVREDRKGVVVQYGDVLHLEEKGVESNADEIDSR